MDPVCERGSRAALICGLTIVQILCQVVPSEGFIVPRTIQQTPAGKLQQSGMCPQGRDG